MLKSNDKSVLEFLDKLGVQTKGTQKITIELEVDKPVIVTVRGLTENYLFCENKYNLVKTTE